MESNLKEKIVLKEQCLDRMPRLCGNKSIGSLLFCYSLPIHILDLGIGSRQGIWYISYGFASISLAVLNVIA